MSRITTDFHSHILPRADHGSDGLETSLGQLELIASYGIKRVVATPHFYPSRDSVETFLERRSRAAEELRGAMRRGLPEVMLGAEVLICDGIENMEGLERLTVLGTDCILLEMPMTKWSQRTYDTVEEISRMGLSPVMAHVDRYDSRAVDELLELDVKAQLNPSAFESRRQRKNAERWLSEGKVVALGSDLHMVNQKEYRSFSSAIKALGARAGEIEASMLRLLDGAEPLTGKVGG